MGIMRYIFVCVVFCFDSLTLSTPNNHEKIPCDTELANVERGEIGLSPVMANENVNCRWTVSAPPSKKLLITIKNIYLASENDTLSVSIDGYEYNVPRECEKCWTNMVGEIMSVTFSSRNYINASENELSPDIFQSGSDANYSSSFVILYSSFDPLTCQSPEHPLNGFSVGRNWTKGGQVHYRCTLPYELFGNEKANCVVLEDSPIPTWDSGPPRCIIPLCQERGINRTASKGILVHPGYPSKSIRSNQRCRWNIAILGRRRISITIKNFSLPVVKTKRKGSRSFMELFDGEHEKLLLHLQGQVPSQSLVTDTNKLTVFLQTGNLSAQADDASVSFGFLIEYSATCEMLESTANGYFSPYNLTLGSNVTVRCDDGFLLEGAAVLHCLPNASWDSPVPSCLPQNITIANFDTVSTTDKIVSDDNDIKIMSNFPVKGTKKSEGPHEQSAAEKEKDEKLFKDNKKIPVALDETGSGVEPEAFEESAEDVEEMNTFKIGMIALGVFLPILFTILFTSVYCWYRKRYPARMGFGRKFETFENPIYQKHKRHPLGPVTNENPAELQRLTPLSSP